MVKSGGIPVDLYDPENNIWDRIDKQADCLPEELDELFEAIEERNPIKLRDALCDISVFVMGAAHIAGLPFEEDMKEVFNSNMSKFCENEDVLASSLRKYRELEIEVDVRGNYPNVYLVSSQDQWGLDDKFYPLGKFLKSTSFIEPIFKDLLNP